MKQKVTKYLIALTLALMPMLVSAQATKYTDTATKLTYTLDGTGATIVGVASGTTLSGVLKIPATVSNGVVSGPVVGISGGDVKIDINDGHVTSFNGIYNNDAITSIDFSAVATQLTSIGDYAFHDCGGLTGDLNLSGLTKLTSIGDLAFDGCTKLTGLLSLPFNTVFKTIGMKAFNFCGFTNNNLLFPPSITEIGDNAFLSCSKLTGRLDLSYLNLPAIGLGTFGGCVGLNYLVLPATPLFIGDNAFLSCGFTNNNLEIPSTVMSIGLQAFYGCTELTGNLDLSKLTMLTEIGDNAFGLCKGLKGELTLPNGILSRIGAQAFDLGPAFTNNILTIPASVKTIGNYAFRYNQFRAVSFDSQTIDMSTTGLGHGLFEGDSKLEYIDMHNCRYYTGTVQSLSRADVTSLFYGTPAHTLIYLSPTIAADALPASPNNMNYVRNADALLGPAYVNCDWFYVQDGCDYYVPIGFNATKATWNVAGTGSETTPNATRTLAAEFTTAYLPYDFTLSGLKGYALGHKNNHTSGDDTDNTFVFNQVTSFAANTPYVIRGASGTAFPEASSVKVSKTPIGRIVYDESGASYDGGTAISNTNGGTPIPDPSKTGTWGIYGSTEAIPTNLWNTWNVYTLGGDAKWYQYVDKSASLPQFRAFIVGNGTPATSKPNFSFVNLDGTEDTTNGIDGLNVVNTGETHIYNVNGQYLGTDFNALPKGLYIVNGKKVVK